MDKSKTINFKLKNNCDKIIKIKTYKFSPHNQKLTPQFKEEKNSQRNYLKIRIYYNCGKDVEKIVEKVFHKKNEFSTEKLSINFIND